eukprot:4615137-Prymnesium_polylepis.1
MLCDSPIAAPHIAEGRPRATERASQRLWHGWIRTRSNRTRASDRRIGSAAMCPRHTGTSRRERL